MIFIYAFIIGGIICMIGQLIMDFFKLTPGHITGIFVISGVFLDFFGIYDKLIKFSGAGALLPITSFGHSMAHFAYKGAKETGFLGLSNGLFGGTSSGIVWAIVLSLLIGIFFKPRG